MNPARTTIRMKKIVRPLIFSSSNPRSCSRAGHELNAFHRSCLGVRACLFLFILFLNLPVKAEWFTETQDKMGTRVEVQLWHADSTEAAQLISDAMAEFDRIEDAMSTYRLDSEITHLNNTAATKPVVVGGELFGLIDRALQLSVKTSGAFDITYDSVGQLSVERATVRSRD